MNRRHILSLSLATTLGLAVTAGLNITRAHAQPRDPVEAYLAAAKKAAGFDFPGTLVRICVAPQTAPGPDVAPAPPPDRSTWYTDPAKVFDNLYFVGTKIHSSWALTTSQGIILIDTLYDYASEEAIVGGLKKVGLDPANVKYVIVGHGHGDHFGGASYFQDHFGAKVGLTAADWDVMYPATPPANANANQIKPRRDLVLAEGQPLTLGDTTVTFVAIPGHTPGSLAFIFPVKEGRQRHVAGLFGGTILTADLITTPGLQQYVQSISHYLDVAKRMKVDVEVQNHAIFDMTPERIAALKARKAGEPNPFAVGTDRYVKFWSIVSECMQAEIARR